jgi:hypothetical protein
MEESGGRAQDEALAAAISRVWLALPDGVRRRGWPAWQAQAAAPIAFTGAASR